MPAAGIKEQKYIEIKQYTNTIVFIMIHKFVFLFFSYQVERIEWNSIELIVNFLENYACAMCVIIFSFVVESEKRKM